jgi:hypothetical protein
MSVKWASLVALVAILLGGGCGTSVDTVAEPSTTTTTTSAPTTTTSLGAVKLNGLIWTALYTFPPEFRDAYDPPDTEDPEILSSVLVAIEGLVSPEEDIVGGLTVIYEAAVAAGMDPSHDFGIRGEEVRALNAQIEVALNAHHFKFRDAYDPPNIEDPEILSAVLVAIEELVYPEYDIVGSLTLIYDAAVAAGMPPHRPDFGASVAAKNEADAAAEAAAEAERLADIRTGPKVEVIEVSVSGPTYDPVFSVTFRNRHSSPVIGVDIRLYAYNIFGDGLGGECGRFPSYYAGTETSGAKNGETFVVRLTSLCLDGAETARVEINRILFEDGTTFR